MEFKERLKNLRKEKQLTQLRLGEMLNYGYTAIANYESGRNEPSITDLKKIAAIFDVSLDYLLGVSEARQPYIIDEQTQEFQAFHRRFSQLSPEKRENLLLYMQFLSNQDAAISPSASVSLSAPISASAEPDNPFADDFEKPPILRVAQKRDDFS